MECKTSLGEIVTAMDAVKTISNDEVEKIGSRRARSPDDFETLTNGDNGEENPVSHPEPDVVDLTSDDTENLASDGFHSPLRRSKRQRRTPKEFADYIWYNK